MYKLGIDLGGTKIEGIVLDENHRELFRPRIPTEQEKGYDHILSNIKKLYTEMKKKIKGGEHTLGVGTPGAVSHKTGRLKNSNSTCLNNRLSKNELETILEHPIGIENDANCFALAEALHGAAQGKNLVFGVIMGTGCGGGIVHHGELITGLQDISGEWGHMSIDPNGPVCYCKMRGCVETFISGGGLERRFASEHGKKLPLKEIVALYRKKDPEADEFMKTFFRHFGRALANLINVLDPDAVVLGGGVSNMDELYTDGIAEVKRQVFSDSLETPILKNKLGDSAGVIGAALIGKPRDGAAPETPGKSGASSAVNMRPSS